MTIENALNPYTLHPETAFVNEYVKIEMDRNAKFISVEWLQHPDSDAFRLCFNEAVKLTIESGCQYWLSDSRAVHYLGFADQNWMLEHILPLLPCSRLQKFARISTVESLALMDLSRIFASIEQLPGLDIKTELEVFTSKDDAIHWLAQ